jgi:hypothetical protein
MAQAIKNVIVDVKQENNVDVKQESNVDVKQAGNVGAELKEDVNDNKVVSQDPEDYIVGKTCCHFHAHKTGYRVLHYVPINLPKYNLQLLEEDKINEMINSNGGMLPIMAQGCTCHGGETFTFCKLVDAEEETMVECECGCGIDIDKNLAYVYNPIDWIVYNTSFFST